VQDDLHEGVTVRKTYISVAVDFQRGPLGRPEEVARVHSVNSSDLNVSGWSSKNGHVAAVKDGKMFRLVENTPDRAGSFLWTTRELKKRECPDWKG